LASIRGELKKTAVQRERERELSVEHELREQEERGPWQPKN
jgi:hypothetical protein